MGLLAGAVPAFGTGWLLAGRMLAPIGRVTRAAATIAAGNLHRRVDLNGPYDEVKQLADTFDDMLSRLERAFEAQRRFTANASHELLTPLAVARAVLETGTPGPDTAKLLELNERSEHTVVALLTLARADQAPAGRDPVDLRALVADAVTRAQPSATVAGVTVETDLADAVVGGDPMLCAHLADNLLANAVRYNHPGGQVVVSLVRRPDRSAALTVVNTGPVVAADSVAGLFEPFVRAEGRSNRGADGGHGLGMAIVRAVVQAHGGTVTAAANPEGGLTVTAAFPGCITGTAGRI
jgi:signal transduction histidine kinase